MGRPKKALKKVLSPITPVTKKLAEEAGRHARDFQESMMPDVNINLPDQNEAQVDLSGSLAAENERRKRRGGRASTILTTSQGAAGGANVGTKTLLGG